MRRFDQMEKIGFVFQLGRGKTPRSSYMLQCYKLQCHHNVTVIIRALLLGTSWTGWTATHSQPYTLSRSRGRSTIPWQLNTYMAFSIFSLSIRRAFCIVTPVQLSRAKQSFPKSFTPPFRTPSDAVEDGGDQ